MISSPRNLPKIYGVGFKVEFKEQYYFLQLDKCQKQEKFHLQSIYLLGLQEVMHIMCDNQPINWWKKWIDLMEV
jgi:hypothetical protein